VRAKEREALVASGRALLQLSVYFTTTVPSLAALRPVEREVREAFHHAGLACSRGLGRQLTWWRLSTECSLA
jgi:hypothetical protein